MNMVKVATAAARWRSSVASITATTNEGNSNDAPMPMSTVPLRAPTGRATTATVTSPAVMKLSAKVPPRFVPNRSGRRPPSTRQITIVSDEHMKTTPTFSRPISSP